MVSTAEQHDQFPAVCLAVCSVPAGSRGGEIAQHLLEERLAACVHLLPAGKSFFFWKGEMEQAEEMLMVIKTSDALYPVLEHRLQALHPYDLPEILRLPVEGGLAGYLSWVLEQLA